MNAHAPEERSHRLANLLSMGRRLAEALDTDIKALERGDFASLATTDPEFAKLCALYARDVAAAKGSGELRAAPREITAPLKETGLRLRKLLIHHAKLVAAMREASEGLMQAVAGEVEKTRRAARPYGAQGPAKPSSGSAILYNRVV
jgi:hypothetical protein